MGEDARRGPISEEHLLTVHTLHGESSESLEGDRGRDRVQQCHLLTSFQEGPHQKIVLSKIFSQSSASKMANCRIVDIVNYLMLLLANSLQLIFIFLFPFIKYEVRMRAREEDTQESEEEWWARLDKRIERARARHELALEWEPFF